MPREFMITAQSDVPVLPLISLVCIAVAGMSARGVETLLQVTVRIPSLMFLAWP